MLAVSSFLVYFFWLLAAKLLFFWFFFVIRVLRLRRNTHSFNSLLFRAGLGHLGKEWIVRGTTRRLLYLADGLFYPSWNRSYRLKAYR